MGARGGAREHANSRIRGYSALWAEHLVLAGACKSPRCGRIYVLLIIIITGRQLASTLHRAPVGQGPPGPGWLAISFGFWSGRALATGTAWAGLCLIHHHHHQGRKLATRNIQHKQPNWHVARTLQDTQTKHEGHARCWSCQHLSSGRLERAFSLQSNASLQEAMNLHRRWRRTPL